jgi:hypothetical protein
MKTFGQVIDARGKNLMTEWTLPEGNEVMHVVFVIPELSEAQRAVNMTITTKGIHYQEMNESKTEFRAMGYKNDMIHLVQRIRGMGTSGHVMGTAQYKASGDLYEGSRARGKRENWMPQPQRRKASAALKKAIGKIYYDVIPMHSIIKELKRVDIVVLQEDNTEWSGMLMGRDSHTLFRLGNANLSSPAPWSASVLIYPEYHNAGLALQWYRQDKRRDGKYEINGYIT